uniref:FCH and double SH3 domains 2 n=1 Tax=Neolamprologus brichardi TaxID=32507 RepID=A0A3Q4HKE6_NEOBR
MAQAVREKAELDAKSKLSLFQSRSSLQRASVKLKAKRSECNSKATHARNDYLLMLAAANAHQQRYYNTDLIDCIKILDGRIYEQVKDYLVSLCQTELEAYQAVHNIFNQILNSSNGVSLKQLFVQKNMAFQQAPDFMFQPVDSDTVNPDVFLFLFIIKCIKYHMQLLLKESGTAEEHTLDKEARKWASRVAREYKSIIHTQKVRTSSNTDSFCRHQDKDGEASEPNNSELETKMEVARQSLRRAETVKAKAEARLDLLREAGVPVETWLKSAMNQVMEELENERWNNLSTHDPSLSVTADLEREDEEEMEDSGEVLDDSSSSPSSTLKNYPLTCKVLYSYKASQPDELTIEEQEILEVIDDGDMEDWVKAGGRACNSTEPETELPTGSVNGDSSVSFAKALYDYAGQTEDELSFPEGAIIRILSRETHEDDGFWEGEFNGVVGVFPAVLVEDLTVTSENGDGQRDGSAQVGSPGGFLQVRAAPPPPKQHPRGQVKRREEVEITLV